MSNVPRRLQSWISTLQTVVLTADVFFNFNGMSQVVVLLPIWFSNLKIFPCFGIKKSFNLNTISFFVYYFPKKSIGITRNCPFFGLGAVRAVVRWRVDVYVPVLGCWSMISVKWGGIMATRGYYINLEDLRGNTPPTCGQKEGCLRSLVHRGSVIPNNVLQKRERGVRARQRLQAHC